MREGHSTIEGGWGLVVGVRSVRPAGTTDYGSELEWVSNVRSGQLIQCCKHHFHNNLLCYSLPGNILERGQFSSPISTAHTQAVTGAGEWSTPYGYKGQVSYVSGHLVKTHDAFSCGRFLEGWIC